MFHDGLRCQIDAIRRRHRKHTPAGFTDLIIQLDSS